MHQIVPSEKYSGMPCSLVALNCMADYYGLTKDYKAVIKENDITYKMMATLLYMALTSSYVLPGAKYV